MCARNTQRSYSKMSQESKRVRIVQQIPATRESNNAAPNEYVNSSPANSTYQPAVVTNSGSYHFEGRAISSSYHFDGGATSTSYQPVHLYEENCNAREDNLGNAREDAANVSFYLILLRFSIY